MAGESASGFSKPGVLSVPGGPTVTGVIESVVLPVSDASSVPGDSAVSDASYVPDASSVPEASPLSGVLAGCCVPGSGVQTVLGARLVAGGSA